MWITWNGEIFQMSLLFLNAKPELDFKYVSKCIALSFDRKAAYQAILNGAWADEYVTVLELCLSILDFRSFVEPI